MSGVKHQFCRANITKHCQTVFQTKSRRTKVCPACKARLKQIKLTVREFLKMKEYQVQEKAEWHDKDNCTIVRTTINKRYDDKGELQGTNEQTQTLKGTLADINKNIEDLNSILEKNSQEIAKKTAELDKIGERPEHTNESRKVQAILEKISKMQQYDKIRAEIDELQKNEEYYQENLRARQKTAAEYPYKETEN